MRAALALALIAAPALAGEPAEYPLEGYAIHGGAVLADPDPAAPEGTHLHVVMTGAAAQAFYDALAAPEAEDACTGGRLKQAPTGITCLALPDGTAECFFAIDLRDGTLGPAGIVC